MRTLRTENAHTSSASYLRCSGWDPFPFRSHLPACVKGAPDSTRFGTWESWSFAFLDDVIIPPIWLDRLPSRQSACRRSSSQDRELASRRLPATTAPPRPPGPAPCRSSPAWPRRGGAAMATSPPRGRHGHATSRPATPRSDGEDEWYDTPPGSSAAAATTAAAADVADADPAAASAAAATVVTDAADVELSAADPTGDGVPAADATGDGLFAADATGVGLFLADATGGDLPAADTPGGGGGDPPAGGAWSGGSPAADGGAAAGGSSDGGSAAGYASAGDTLGDAPPAGDATGGGLPAGDASGGQAAAGRPPGGGAVAGDAPRRGSAGGYASDGGSSLGDASGSDGVVGVASPVGSSPAVAAFVSDADEPADADAVGDTAVGGDAAASDGSATASAAASVADAGGSDAAASVADADASDAAASVADDGGDDVGDAAARGARLGTLTGRLHAMMMDEALCDCVVVVAGRRYPCVRVVLAQGSAFFRAMFFGAHPMAEREAGEATLEGVSRTGWEAVRLWLYTARVRIVGSASASPRDRCCFGLLGGHSWVRPLPLPVALSNCALWLCFFSTWHTDGPPLCMHSCLGPLLLAAAWPPAGPHVPAPSSVVSDGAENQGPPGH